MGSESIAHEAVGQIGYMGERNNYCFSKIQLVGPKLSRQNILHLLKHDLNFFLLTKHLKCGRCFLPLVGYNV